MATVSKPSLLMASRIVSLGGSSEKSCLFEVRVYSPSLPINGRAITRPTPCSPTNKLRAILQYL